MFKLLAVFSILLLGVFCAYNEELSSALSTSKDPTEYFQPKFIEYMTAVAPKLGIVIAKGVDILATEAEKAKNLDEVYKNVGETWKEMTELSR